MADIKRCDVNFKLTAGKRETLFEFYKDTTVLITGGTGFLGKVLMEKLLRCFGVKCIYLLIREKNGMTVEQRLVEYFKETVSVFPLFCFAMIAIVMRFADIRPIA
jgi:FlaA1/EpsC-like NDP-sugar epimerase